MPFKFDDSPSATAEIARKVTNMSDEMVGDVRAVVRDSFTAPSVDKFTGRAITGFSSHESASRLKDFIGMTKPQLAAAKVYENGLIAGGTKPALLKRLMDRYKKKKLLQRSRTIARTESMDVLNRGIGKAWNQADKEGQMSPGMLKVWILSPDELLCPLCVDMQGRTVPFNRDFSPTNPPRHPNCRCTYGLVSGEESDVLRRVRQITADVNANSLFTESGFSPGFFDAVTTPNSEAALLMRATFLKRQRAISRKGLKVKFPRGTMHGTVDKIVNRQMIAVVDTSMRAMEEALKNGDFALALKHWNKINGSKLAVEYASKKGTSWAWFNRAAFPDFNPKMYINLTEPSWTSWEALQEASQEAFMSGHWGSPFPESVIHHEAGHAFHFFNNPTAFQTLGTAYKSKDNWLKAGQIVLTPGQDLLGRQTGETITSMMGRTQRNIFTDVSGYAASDPLEFVAESYVKKITHLSPDVKEMAVPRPDILPPWLQALYDDLGGFNQ